MTDDLVAFVSARLDEDEALARQATAEPGMAAEWHETTSGCLDIGLPDHGGEDWRDFVWPQGDSRVTRFIARHDPARVLREVEAKRAILAQIAPWMDSAEDDHWYERGVGKQPPYEGSVLLMELLAAVWSYHPDYRQEWKP